MMMKLLKEYLRTIKNIQECQELGVNPYGLYELNNQRIRLHRKIADYFGIKNEAEYLKLREIFSNMDLICDLYSKCEEWKLKDNTDIALMADNLNRFLGSAEARMFIQGDVSELKQLPCFRNRF